MKNLKIFVVAILLISLIINFSLLSRISNLEGNVNSISSYQNQIMDSVNRQSGTINNILTDFKREQSWIGPIRMDAGTDQRNLDKGTAILNFEWQIKELFNNSEVIFHYKVGEDQQYSSVSTEEIESGIFNADIPIEVELEPEWHINISKTGQNNRNNQHSVSTIEEESFNNRNSQLSYYVTVSNDDLVKSSEIRTTHIDYLGARYYGVLDIFAHFYDEGYNFQVMGATSYHVDNDISLEEAYLMKYQNGQLVDEEKLISDDINSEPGAPTQERPAGFHRATSEEKNEFTTLVVRAIFSDGASFEKEIHTN